jgi:hypothetical protein
LLINQNRATIGHHKREQSMSGRILLMAALMLVAGPALA